MKVIIVLILFFLGVFSLKSEEFDNSNSVKNHSLHHHNHLALFSGATSNIEHKSTNLSIGFDYEHRFSFIDGLFGIGLFGELVFTEHNEILVGIPIFLHPAEKLKFIIAPATIKYEEENFENNQHILQYKNDYIQAQESSNIKKHNDFLFRVGLTYDFHFYDFSFSPTFNIDIHNGNFIFVYGFSIGFGF